MPIELVKSVSFEDCHRELIQSGGAAALAAYDKWRKRQESEPAFGPVVSFVESFTHTHLFNITEACLEQTKVQSEHALGNLRKEEVEDRRIEDFHTPFALHHLFHRYLEEQANVPTWQEWWLWLIEGDGKPLYIAQVQKRFAWASLTDAERAHLRDSVRWRLGKVYYSAVREVELLIKLRTRFKLPVKYHVLADVLLRADLWQGKTIVSLFFGNPRYRDQEVGRKNRPQLFLNSGFRFIEATLPRQGFGTFWRITEYAVESLAKKLADHSDEEPSRE